MLAGLDADSRKTLLDRALPQAERAGYWQGELQHFDRHGALVPVLASITCHRNDKGEVDSYSCIARDVTTRKHYERQLETSRQELRQLSNALVRAQEDERKQIAQELHDELGAQMTAMKLDADWLGQRLEGEARARSQGLARLLDETMDATRRLYTRLRPPLIDTLGLAPALEWLVERMDRRTTIPIALNGPVETLNEVDETRAVALFRVVQEAINNAIKHARATKIQVRVIPQTSTLRVEVMDDGKGLRANDFGRTGHLGLSGMRQRLHHLNGELRFASVPSGGTLVIAEIEREEKAA